MVIKQCIPYKINKENCSLLNQIYEILAELQGQDKRITLCNIPTHIGIKESKEADKAVKQAIELL